MWNTTLPLKKKEFERVNVQLVNTTFGTIQLQFMVSCWPSPTWLLYHIPYFTCDFFVFHQLFTFSYFPWLNYHKQKHKHLGTFTNMNMIIITEYLHQSRSSRCMVIRCGTNQHQMKKKRRIWEGRSTLHSQDFCNHIEWYVD